MGNTIPMKSKRQPKTLEQSVDELELILSTVCKGIVDTPSDVVIARAVSPTGFVAFEVTCREEEAGALLGRKGANAEAIRFLMMAAAAARGLRITLQIMGAQGGVGRR